MPLRILHHQFSKWLARNRDFSQVQKRFYLVKLSVRRLASLIKALFYHRQESGNEFLLNKKLVPLSPTILQRRVN